MSVRNRFLAVVAASACTVLLAAACSEVPTTSSPRSALRPLDKPSFGRALPLGCDYTVAGGCGKVTTDVGVAKEELKVCKWYPAGTVNPPAVQVVLDVKTDNAPPEDSKLGIVYVIQPNTCQVLWLNGEDRGPLVDTVWVTELVPTGYTASSQVTTVKRIGPRGPGVPYDTTINAPSSATTIKGYIGGFEVPGMLINFTNTADAPPPPPPAGCTLTQGYWKNHEEKWPAPYSPTAPWLTAGNLVTGTTWDGLMGIPPKKGNSYLQLAHQWIAATLNKASGASVPANVQTTLDASAAWLLANTPVNGALPVLKNDQATTWAGILDNYNNGLTGPGHCD